MESAIKVNYSWQTADLVRAFKYHQKSSKYFWISRLFLHGLGLLNIGFGLMSLLRNKSYEFALFQLAIGSILLLREVITNLVYKWRCQKLGYDNKQVEWEFRAENIVHRMINLTESTFNWDLIRGILDTPEGFLLYPQKNFFYFIPKSAFESEADIAQFVFLAQDKVKNWQQIK